MNLNTNKRYKVVILAAGKGRRLEEMTANTHKALLPLGSKPVLSHIIEKFPLEAEFIVALGHKKEELSDFLTLAYPQRSFQFVEVQNFDRPGSGPGASLMACKEAIGADPFIITTVDTLVLEDIPPPDYDWLGIAPITLTKKYNSIRWQGEMVTNMQDKVECDNTHAFIGLCGVKNTKIFWDGLQKNHELISGELQLSNGLKPLVNKGMRGAQFTWFDTGDKESFSRTSKALDPTLEEAFDFSKKNEFIYFVNGRVIKYFEDKTVTRRRVERAEKLSGFVPKIEKEQNHFYSYQKMEGQVLYSVLNDLLVEDLLVWLKNDFWQEKSLSLNEKENFKKACKKFYFDKTMERIERYFQVTKEKDATSCIHGIEVPALHELLSKVPWESLYDGIPGRFHGDLQFDNILVTPLQKSRFLLIDWRQDFAGVIDYGDIYYDLAKLYGGTLLPYDLIKKGLFSFVQMGREIFFSVTTRQSLLRARQIFLRQIQSYGFDIQKIKWLTALIFLNMSPLHEPPFNFLLHHLGKLELFQNANGQEFGNWLQPTLS